MKRKLEEYLERDLFGGDVRKMFYRWDMEKALRDASKWMTQARWLVVYVIANNCTFRTLHAWVGCHADAQKRLKQHNGEIPGGPAATRKAAPHWRSIVHLIVPPFRNYSTKGIKKMCKRGRGWVSRCKRVIRLAHKKGLSWQVTRDIFDQESPFYSQGLSDLVLELVPEKQLDSVYLD